MSVRLLHDWPGEMLYYKYSDLIAHYTNIHISIPAMMNTRVLLIYSVLTSYCAVCLCGDDRIEPRLGEECDDGNRIEGDGCSKLCCLEVCGNGRVDHHEECDDGNALSGDGCSTTCRL